MHTNTFRRALVALAVVALAATAAACSNDDTAVSGDNQTSNSAVEDAGRPDDVNDADVEFVRAMIPHHEQAVEMSDMVIERGADPSVIALAEQIRDAQGPEIEQMSGWLEEWGVPADTQPEGGHGEHGGAKESSAGDGMMTTEEMDEMASVAGAELDRAFLEMMIRHHEGAIDMAQVELDDGSNEAVLAVARNIVDTQQAEIDQMTSMTEDS